MNDVALADKEHVLTDDQDCWCNPRVETFEDGSTLTIHRSAPEIAKELEDVHAVLDEIVIKLMDALGWRFERCETTTDD